MTMSTQTPAHHYESAVRAMSQAAAESELTHAPVRLAYWRITALDTLLDRLDENPLADERVLSQGIREHVLGYTGRPHGLIADWRLRNYCPGTPPCHST